MQKKDSNLVFRLLELVLLDDKSSDSEMMDERKDEKTDVPTVAWWGECPPKRGEVHR